MVNVIVELVVGVTPLGTYEERQGHSRGKWNLKLKHGMTPVEAIQKLKKCKKFKAKFPEKLDGYIISWHEKGLSKSDPGTDLPMESLIDHRKLYHELIVNDESMHGDPSVDITGLTGGTIYHLRLV